MKKSLIFFLSFILFLSLTSCTTAKKAEDNSVTIKGVEYKAAFVNSLYPSDEQCLSSNGIMTSGKTCYKYIKSKFDCYIAYDSKANPNVYFKSEQFDEAKEYYGNADNFNFFFLRGNIFDEENQLIFELTDLDYAMFDKLVAFSDENNYSPFNTSKNEDKLISFPVNPQAKVMNEMHFYKESKDGAFSTSLGHTYLIRSGKMYLLYYYDAGEKIDVMRVKEIPTELSDYFCNLVKETEQDDF